MSRVLRVFKAKRRNFARQVVEFTVEVEQEPDDYGKARYTMLWTCPSTGRPRGQCFHAPLPKSDAEFTDEEG